MISMVKPTTVIAVRKNNLNVLSPGHILSDDTHWYLQTQITKQWKKVVGDIKVFLWLQGFFSFH